MISPKMCSRIYFYADRQRSRRYKREDLLDALNIAQQSVKLDRYDNIKRETGYSFELVQRVRDELYTILQNAPAIPALGVDVVQPSDYDLEVLCFMTINGKDVLSTSRTYEESDLATNVYAKPSQDYPIHRKTATGWKCELNGGGFTAMNLWYLRPQVDIFWDDTDLPAGTALSAGVKYYVNNTSVTYNSITYNKGAVVIGLGGALVTSGGTVNIIVNCELPDLLHEEICKVAASILMGTFENYQKSARIQQEVQRS